MINRGHEEEKGVLKKEMKQGDKKGDGQRHKKEEKGDKGLGRLDRQERSRLTLPNQSYLAVLGLGRRTRYAQVGSSLGPTQRNIARLDASFGPKPGPVWATWPRIESGNWPVLGPASALWPPQRGPT